MNDRSKEGKAVEKSAEVHFDEPITYVKEMQNQLLIWTYAIKIVSIYQRNVNIF